MKAQQAVEKAAAAKKRKKLLDELDDLRAKGALTADAYEVAVKHVIKATAEPNKAYPYLVSAAARDDAYHKRKQIRKQKLQAKKDAAAAATGGATGGGATGGGATGGGATGGGGATELEHPTAEGEDEDKEEAEHGAAGAGAKSRPSPMAQALKNLGIHHPLAVAKTAAREALALHVAAAREDQRRQQRARAAARAAAAADAGSATGGGDEAAAVAAAAAATGATGATGGATGLTDADGATGATGGEAVAGALDGYDAPIHRAPAFEAADAQAAYTLPARRRPPARRPPARRRSPALRRACLVPAVAPTGLQGRGRRGAEADGGGWAREGRRGGMGRQVELAEGGVFLPAYWRPLLAPSGLRRGCRRGHARGYRVHALRAAFVRWSRRAA